MRALVWIVEDTWQATVTAAAALLPADAEIKLLHVTPTDAEQVARGAPRGLLGRPMPKDAAPFHALTEQSATDLLCEAQQLLGRVAVIEERRGRIEREVLAAAEGIDLLVLARDGARSLRPSARFVVDHASCDVLLVGPRPS